MSEFKVGDHVEKYTGEAQYKGVIVCVYKTLKGYTRYVIEVEPQGFQMITSAVLIRHATSTLPESCVTHTEAKVDYLHSDKPQKPIMKYLAYVQGVNGPVGQLWTEDFRISPTTNKHRTEVLRVIELLPKEQSMSIKALMACYPYPDFEPGVI